MSNGEVQKALKALDNFQEENEERIFKVFTEYNFEMYDFLESSGVELPQSVTERIQKERLRRENASKAECEKLFGRPMSKDIRLHEDLEKYVLNSPMNQEVKQILDGKWPGKPHWSIEDWE